MAEHPDHQAPDRHSAAADAAAVKWGDAHPEEDVEHPPPRAPTPPDEGVPDRHSASAESAAERLHRAEEEEDH
jgi:hypothetical protein